MCRDGVVEEVVGVGRHHAEVALGVGECALDGDEFEVEEAARGAVYATLPGGAQMWVFVGVSQGGDGGKRDGVAGLFERVDEWVEGVGEIDVLCASACARARYAQSVFCASCMISERKASASRCCAFAT